MAEPTPSEEPTRSAPAGGASGPAPADGPRALLAEGVRLFNAGEYLPAHEVLEELWEGTHGADSDFYKGLLQAAIALHHFREGNLGGARKLYSGHRRYLAPYLPCHAELDLAAFLADMQGFLRPVLRAREGDAVRFDAERRPRIRTAG